MANQTTTKTQSEQQQQQQSGTVIVTNWAGTVTRADLDFAKQVGGDPRDWR